MWRNNITSVQAESRQNISFILLKMLELLNKENKSWQSLIKFMQFFNHSSAPRQKFKNLIGNFFAISLRSLMQNFSPLALKLRASN